MNAITWLFVPATRTDRIAKAFLAGAHAVIVDLEDAIDPADKAKARDQLANFLASSRSPVWVRVNAVSTKWFSDDMSMLRTHQNRIAGIMLPKTESHTDLDHTTIASASNLPVIALIESARGILALTHICSHASVVRLAFGSADLSSDLGCEDTYESLLSARAQLVLHSSAVRLPAPIDGVTFSVDVPSLVRDDAARAARMGFGAKLCIHPSQLASTLEGFRPSDHDVLWAEKIVAVTGVQKGVIKLEGNMVDKPVIERAHQTLRMRDACNGISTTST
jgi:citrate lyase subunit beta/citryl-CoA lyase